MRVWSCQSLLYSQFVRRTFSSPLAEDISPISQVIPLSDALYRPVLISCVITSLHTTSLYIHSTLPLRERSWRQYSEFTFGKLFLLLLPQAIVHLFFNLLYFQLDNVIIHYRQVSFRRLISAFSLPYSKAISHTSGPVLRVVFMVVSTASHPFLSALRLFVPWIIYSPLFRGYLANASCPCFISVQCSDSFSIFSVVPLLLDRELNTRFFFQLHHLPLAFYISHSISPTQSHFTTFTLAVFPVS